MSGAACKVVIDWYGALGVEASAFARDASPVPFLSSEAAALAEAAEIICNESVAMINYLEIVPDGSGVYALAQPHIEQLVAQSGQACDWAKELRGYRDAYQTKRPNPQAIADLVMEMRSWRDAGTTLIQTLAKAQIADGKLPT